MTPDLSTGYGTAYDSRTWSIAFVIPDVLVRTWYKTYASASVPSAAYRLRYHLRRSYWRAGTGRTFLDEIPRNLFLLHGFC